MAQFKPLWATVITYHRVKLYLFLSCHLIWLLERIDKSEWRVSRVTGKLMQLMHNSGSSRGMQSKGDTQGDLWRGWKCAQWHKSMLGRAGFRIHGPSRLQSPLADAGIEEQGGGQRRHAQVYVCMCVCLCIYWCISVCQCIFAFMSRSVSGEYLTLMALCLQILQAELLLIKSKHFTEDCTVLLCLYKLAMCSCVWSLSFIVKPNLS